MTTSRTFPTRGALRRLPFGALDVAVLAVVLVGLYVVLRVGRGAAVSFSPTHVTTVSTDPANLPYYAARSLLRMFVALGLSTLFTLTYGYVAARSRRAEKVLVPLLDILQSVPGAGVPVGHGDRGSSRCSPGACWGWSARRSSRSSPRRRGT